MLGTFDKVDMQIDEIILWLEENIPKAYSGEDLVRAYQRLANVDLFKGRIYKQQYWRFLVYENIFASYGISQAKGNKVIDGFKKYKKPERILKIWLNNQKHGKKKTIAIKYAEKTHVGYKRIMAQWHEIKSQLKNSIIQKELKLDEDEIAYVMKY
jgi:replication factor C large subunit